MKLGTSRVLLGAMFATLLAAGGLGCELIASVDRDKIEDGSGGSGGSPGTGDSGTDAPLDSGQDATSDAGQDVQNDVTEDVADAAEEADAPDDVMEADAPDDVMEADAPDDVMEADAPDDVMEADAPDDVMEADAPDDVVEEADADPCSGVTCDPCEQCVNGTCQPVSDGTSCTDDGNPCTQDECDTGVCTHPAVTDNTPCTSDNNVCTTDACLSGVCSHPAIANDCGAFECGPSPTGCFQCGTCDTPPADVCDTVDPDILQDYGDPGTCTAGSCDYPFDEVTCASGCLSGACNFGNASAQCEAAGSAAGSVTASFTGDVIGSVDASTAFQTATVSAGQTLPDQVKIEACVGSGGLLNIYLFLDSTVTLPVAYDLDAECGHTFSPSTGGCAVLEVVVPDTAGDVTFTTAATWAGTGAFDSVSYGTNTINASFVATGLVDVAAPTSMMNIGSGTMTDVPFPF